MEQGKDRLMSTAEAADRLGVSPRTIARWIKAGELRGVRLGRRLFRVPESEVLQIIAETYEREEILEEAVRWRPGEVCKMLFERMDAPLEGGGGPSPRRTSPPYSEPPSRGEHEQRRAGDRRRRSDRSRADRRGDTPDGTKNGGASPPSGRTGSEGGASGGRAEDAPSRETFSLRGEGGSRA